MKYALAALLLALAGTSWYAYWQHNRIEQHLSSIREKDRTIATLEASAATLRRERNASEKALLEALAARNKLTEAQVASNKKIASAPVSWRSQALPKEVLDALND